MFQIRSIYTKIQSRTVKKESWFPAYFKTTSNYMIISFFSGEDCEFSPMMADSQDTENLCCDLKCKKQAGAICAKGMVCP